MKKIIIYSLKYKPIIEIKKQKEKPIIQTKINKRKSRLYKRNNWFWFFRNLITLF